MGLVEHGGSTSILEAVVDYVFPAQDEPSATGHKLDQPAYRNRLFEFIKRANESGSVSEMTVALAAGLHDRYTAVSKLTNKRVQASMALRAANLCALNTYILCGEIPAAEGAGSGGPEHLTLTLWQFGHRPQRPRPGPTESEQNDQP